RWPHVLLQRLRSPSPGVEDPALDRHRTWFVPPCELHGYDSCNDVTLPEGCGSWQAQISMSPARAGLQEVDGTLAAWASLPSQRRPASPNCAGGVEAEVEIVVDRAHQFFDLVLEEVVCTRDFLVVDRDVPLRAKLLDQFGHSDRLHHGVRRALDEDARGRAGGEEREVVHVGRRRDRNETADLRAAHQELHSDQRAEADTGDPGGLRLGVDRLYPVERGSGVRELADPVVEAALAAPDAAEVEAQR